MVNGSYDKATLDKLNWFLRDWRLNEQTQMDPKLFDILWEVYRESGSQQPIDVLSAYRSPQTNAMLRRRSRQVAKYSQHMEGKAIDAHFIDVTTATIRDIAMRMQAGGVGFYPSGITPWVHVDSGAVRYWPRMSRDALARLFPDGKTVFIPSDGKPMPGYDLAAAEIQARGGDVIPQSNAWRRRLVRLVVWRTARRRRRRRRGQRRRRPRGRDGQRTRARANVVGFADPRRRQAQPAAWRNGRSSRPAESRQWRRV